MKFTDKPPPMNKPAKANEGDKRGIAIAPAIRIRIPV